MEMMTEGSDPEPLNQVFLQGNAQESGIWNNQTCSVPSIWAREFHRPFNLPAIVPQLLCPSALQTCPGNCLAHWITECLHAMLPWGAPDVHAFGIIAAGLTQKRGRVLPTQLQGKEKGYSVAIKRWSIPIFMTPALVSSYWPDGPGVNLFLSNKIQKESSSHCCCCWCSYRLFCRWCWGKQFKMFCSRDCQNAHCRAPGNTTQILYKPRLYSQTTTPHFSTL